MKRTKLKTINLKILLIVFLILELIVVFVVILKPLITLRSKSVILSTGGYINNDINNWVEEFDYYSKLNKLSYKTTDDILSSSLLNYKNYRSNSYKFPLISLPEIVFEISEEKTIDIDPPIEIIKSEKFPQGERYEVQKGESAKYTYKELTMMTRKYIMPVSEVVFEKNTIIADGGANRVQLNDGLIDELKSIQTGDYESSYYRKLEPAEVKVLSKLDIKGVSFDVSQGEMILVGKVEFLNKSCSEQVDLELAFDPQTQQYYFPELGTLKLKDCTIYTPKAVVYAPIVYGPIEVVTCQDCKYAPINKTTALPSTYIPNLIATGLPGGGMLTPETVTALKAMSEDVQSKGMTVFITSAYRSYIQQQSTFNYWVNRELSRGAPMELARQRANIYSATPGHSEHQLGTTLDIRCIGCDAFSKNVTNTPLYQYLQQNAHEYGFVISYPLGKQHLTGYTYEPWHIRYIGVELASELQARGYQNIGNNQYLSAFLREKGLY